ncbi:exodeoxyribonuclease VII small subunit [Orenia metallireducens]|jgi:exodeoxyribonuclease VII small subunit|uniref:Exodeoxyribonuclease 7 small subunit n=1 Tax=Orenia metallireducens TaxID=1413210 RepID=A0A1C0A9M7_9FIRM|nr:exodeoxyribonuclease VII small subunit [Orenia metallireducens]OCL26976.1 exodeoxyribonuclease VII small subunit [Orenia metallireducens]
MGNKSELTFEEALNQLEEAVNNLEKGELTLADSLEEFELGVKLTKFCSDKLEQAQEKIEIIKEENGKIKIEDYNYQGEGAE